ncbi:hypothetical protein GQ44DRAFT_824790, partial [Phaeosphaeriaceae sp. PMI808]
MFRASFHRLSPMSSAVFCAWGCRSWRLTKPSSMWRMVISAYVIIVDRELINVHRQAIIAIHGNWSLCPTSSSN